MIAKIILIAIFVVSDGRARVPAQVDYRTLGEFHDMPSCQAAVKAIQEQAAKLDLHGYLAARFVCTRKAAPTGDHP